MFPIPYLKAFKLTLAVIMGIVCFVSMVRFVYVFIQVSRADENKLLQNSGKDTYIKEMRSL